MGKLFSKLLQIILLLAISLPLLAIVRIFGGVPWNYVLSSLCITLTAVIFAGSLSLYFSINNRRAYVVIIKTVVTLGVLYFCVQESGNCVSDIDRFSSPESSRCNVCKYRDDDITFCAKSDGIISHYADRSIVLLLAIALYANVSCLCSTNRHICQDWLMLVASALLIAISVKIVRKVALRQAVGQIESVTNRTRDKKSKKFSRRHVKQPELSGVIRRVTDSPVLWRELRAPMIQGAEGKNSIIGLVITIIALLITYGTCQGVLDEAFTQVGYVMMFTVIGSVFTIVLSAASVTSEKETRSWPILLATSMDDWHILLGKAIGVFRRCLPIWLLMAGHVLLFICLGYIHPIAILHIPIFVTGLVVFLTGTGLYFSARFKRTTSAVIASFGLALVLWIILPAMLGLVSVFTHDYDAVRELVSANPAAQLVTLMDGAGGSFNARTDLSKLNYQWPDNSLRKIWSTTGLVIIYMLIYTAAGVLFAWRAKCRFRRNVF